jgi:hypothetical protein
MSCHNPWQCGRRNDSSQKTLYYSATATTTTLYTQSLQLIKDLMKLTNKYTSRMIYIGIRL